MKAKWKGNPIVYQSKIKEITRGLASQEAADKRRNYFQSETHKQKAREQALKLAADRRMGVKPPQTNKVYDTKPELAVEAALNELQLPYIKQYGIGPYRFDFYVDQHKLLLEVQGEYWHSLSRNIANDLAKAEYIRLNYPDYQLRYITETDTHARGKCTTIISGMTNTQPIKIDYELTQLVLKPIDSDQAIKFMAQYHYLPRLRKTTRATHGVFLGDTLICVLIYGLPTYNNLAGQYGLKTVHTLELIRFIISPNYQKKNLASWALSRSIKLIKDNMTTICLLISFADQEFGFSGTIYKAANWIPDGETRPSYYYRDQMGNILHKKTVWDHARKMGIPEDTYATQHNLRRVESKPKKKYIYWLNKPSEIDLNVTQSRRIEVQCTNCNALTTISDKGYRKLQRDNKEYTCHPCSLSRKWRDPLYRSKVERGHHLGTRIPESSSVVCSVCGRTRVVKRNHYRTILNRGGYNTCHRCSLKNKGSNHE